MRRLVLPLPIVSGRPRFMHDIAYLRLKSAAAATRRPPARPLPVAAPAPFIDISDELDVEYNVKMGIRMPVVVSETQYPWDLDEIEPSVVKGGTTEAPPAVVTAKHAINQLSSSPNHTTSSVPAQLTVAAASLPKSLEGIVMFTKTAAPVPQADSNVPVLIQRPHKLTIRSSLSSVDLMSKADTIASELIPALPVAGYLHDLASAFTERRLRHEGVIRSALWRVFKWDYHLGGSSQGEMDAAFAAGTAASTESSSLVPVDPFANSYSALANLHPAVLQDLTSSTAAMFELLTTEGFSFDSQLMFVAVSRLAECAPFMLPKDLAAVLIGLKEYNRTHLTLGDVLLQAPNHMDKQLVQDTLGKAPVLEEAGPQGNVLDFLLDKLEKQLKRTAALLTAEDVVRIMEGFTHTGVRDPSVIRDLAIATKRVHFTTFQASKLLQHTATVHERLVSTLVHSPGASLGWQEGGEGSEPITDVEGMLALCAPLFLEAAKKVNHTTLAALGRDSPMLILELRKMCETNALVTKHVPELWDAVRNVYVSNKIIQDSKRRSEFGARRVPLAMDVDPFFKVQNVVQKGVDRKGTTPQAFRKWERKMPWYDDPTKSRREHLATRKAPRRQGFGVRQMKKRDLLINEARRTRGLRPNPKAYTSKGSRGSSSFKGEGGHSRRFTKK